jgi:hypothetical protein
MLATASNQIARPLVDFCSQPDWLALPKATREGLRKIFRIGKSGQTRIQQSVTARGIPNDRVVSDGTQPEDLMKSFNVVEVLKYLGKEFNPKNTYVFSELLPLVLEKAGLEAGKNISAASAKAAEGVPKDKMPQKEEVKKEPKPGKKIKISQKK